jgi:hypothetical protein
MGQLLLAQQQQQCLSGALFLQLVTRCDGNNAVFMLLARKARTPTRIHKRAHTTREHTRATGTSWGRQHRRTGGRAGGRKAHAPRQPRQNPERRCRLSPHLHIFTPTQAVRSRQSAQHGTHKGLASHCVEASKRRRAQAWVQSLHCCCVQGLPSWVNICCVPSSHGNAKNGCWRVWLLPQVLLLPWHGAAGPGGQSGPSSQSRPCHLLNAGGHTHAHTVYTHARPWNPQKCRPASLPPSRPPQCSHGACVVCGSPTPLDPRPGASVISSQGWMQAAQHGTDAQRPGLRAELAAAGCALGGGGVGPACRPGGAPLRSAGEGWRGRHAWRQETNMLRHDTRARNQSCPAGLGTPASSNS